MPSSQPQIPVLSFFTGAGFLDIGFMKAGFDIVWHNEFNQEFARNFCYAMESLTGHPVKHPNTTSIEILTADEIRREAFGDGGVPKIFGMIGGPPCPDFSVGGKNRGSEGENGRLSKVYVDRIEQLQPTFFLFENVPGLLRTEKHRAFLLQLRTQLSSFYETDLKILNALDYGVPQDRERVFFVGVRKDWLAAHGFTPKTLSPSAVGDHWFPYPKPKYPDAKNAFNWPDQSAFGGDPGKPDPTIPSELMVGSYICDQEELAHVPNSDEFFQPYSSKFHEIPEGDDKKKSYKRLHRHRYSPTAAYGNNEVHLHPILPRRLSVREALRIQSVPDEYVMRKDMPLSHKYKTIGNGVPVKLAEQVGQAFRLLLNKQPATVQLTFDLVKDVCAD